MADAFRVFIGFDSRQSVAYEVAAFSLRRRASVAVSVQPIKQRELRAAGLYSREPDPLASTEFTYTRFLTPALAGFSGWALFCDSDFLWLGDVAGLLPYTRDASIAVWCVQHDYRPPDLLKMDGVPQSSYPRKNWSSLMLFNCAHPSVRLLTPDVVNHASAAFLHRMAWAADSEIGALPATWNWLEGWSEKPARGTPNCVHFTRGGPWFENWRQVDYADLWLAELQASRAARQEAPHGARL